MAAAVEGLLGDAEVRDVSLLPAPALTPATGARQPGGVGPRRAHQPNLGADHPTVTISGTIVFLKGKGFFRQAWTKSDAGYRTVVLPQFAAGMLIARKITAVDNPHDAVVTSRRGTWLSPPNVRRQWHQARADTGLEWVTPAHGWFTTA